MAQEEGFEEAAEDRAHGVRQGGTGKGQCGRIECSNNALVCTGQGRRDVGLVSPLLSDPHHLMSH